LGGGAWRAWAPLARMGIDVCRQGPDVPLRRARRRRPALTARRDSAEARTTTADLRRGMGSTMCARAGTKAFGQAMRETLPPVQIQGCPCRTGTGGLRGEGREDCNASDRVGQGLRRQIRGRSCARLSPDSLPRASPARWVAEADTVLRRFARRFAGREIRAGEPRLPASISPPRVNPAGLTGGGPLCVMAAAPRSSLRIRAGMTGGGAAPRFDPAQRGSRRGPDNGWPYFPCPAWDCGYLDCLGGSGSIPPVPGCPASRIPPLRPPAPSVPPIPAIPCIPHPPPGKA
jgi:hypothetical protein